MTTMKTPTALLALALALAGCGVDSSAVYIRGRAASTSDTECVYAPDGEIDLRSGLLDVGTSQVGNLRYRMPLYVRNTLRQPPPAADGTESEAKAWTPYAVKVRIQPGGIGGEVTVAGHAIQAGGGEGTPFVEVIDRRLGLALQQQLAPAVGELRRIVLTIQLRGRTQDDEQLDSNEFTYPLDLCTDCLEAPTCGGGAVLTVGCSGPGQDSGGVCVDPTPAPAG